ncbi:helix-turn-helix domain-containing protein [Streptomyces sp. LD120]|uniref:Helix-turn-helix domain-containing protein n=1 Tax=Streptomyces physcomitrii TaxID=2724184 RepID=A0ABX1GWV0_9ACTN|nr:helix-turn-helix domain-containing protein [Streptomyces physcomitrii]
MTQTPHARALPPAAELRRLREARNLSRSALASRLGVPVSRLRRWEKGRAQPEAELLTPYVRELGLDITPSVGTEAANSVSPQGSSDSPARADSAAEESDATAPEAVAADAASSSASVSVSAPDGASGPDSDPDSDSDPDAAPDAAPDTDANPQDANPGTGADAALEKAPNPPPESPSPGELFDSLYELTSAALVRQTYLLTGHRRLACEAVEQAFQHAWRHWPEVAADPDPAGWVRAAAHEYALSPWHRLRPGRERRGTPPAHRQDRELLAVLGELPPTYRRTLVLHDGVGLPLPETAAETESSTAATTNRLRHARRIVGARVPELSAVHALRERLARLAEESAAEGPRPARMRKLSERRTRQWTRAALGLTAAVVTATVFTLHTAPGHYEPPVPHGAPVGGVPARMGPQSPGHQAGELHARLTEGPLSGPERLHPDLD